MNPHKNKNPHPITPSEKPTLGSSQRIEALRSRILEYNASYYQKGISKISDYEYDDLFRELKILEQQHPDLQSSASPTQTVGASPLPAAKPFIHPLPMLSLGNAMDEDELRDFFQKRNKDLRRDSSASKHSPQEDTAYCISPKYDGIAIELLYINGTITTASTRGNGQIGETITQHISSIPSIPQKLRSTQRGVQTGQLLLRGEMIMLRSHLKTYNTRLSSLYEKALSVAYQNGTSPPPEPTLLSNPRNAVAGGLRQHKSDPHRLEKLLFFAYQIFTCRDPEPRHQNKWEAPASHYAAYTSIRKLGFNQKLPSGEKHPHQKYAMCGTSLDEVADHYRMLMEHRCDLDFEIDGMVVEFDKHKDRARLGVVGRRPRYAVAWKFPPEIKVTILRDVIFQVGRTGAITPTGIVEPVLLSGAEVRRVTLHNQREIQKLDLRIGDHVQITRSGDVIPKILSVITSARDLLAPPITFPQRCPSCDAPLRKADGSEIIINCTNPACPAQELRTFSHFVSKSALNMEGISEKILAEMISKGIIKKISDLYALTQAQIMTMDRMGEKLATNILKAIETSKSTSLQRFLIALGIPRVGERSALTLAQYLQKPEKLLSLTKDELIALPDMGALSAAAIITFFCQEKNRTLLKDLLKAGVHPSPPPSRQFLPLSAYSLVFTGTFTSIARRIAKEKAIALGATVGASLSHKTSHLVYGEKAGSKLKKAHQLGIKIISEADFMTLLEEPSDKI